MKGKGKIIKRKEKIEIWGLQKDNETRKEEIKIIKIWYGEHWNEYKILLKEEKRNETNDVRKK